MMNCHKCGYELPLIAKFCRSCGVAQQQTPQPAKEAPPTTTGQAAAEPAPISKPASAKSRSTSSRWPLVLGFALLLIAAMGGIGYWGWQQQLVAEERLALLAELQVDAQERDEAEEQRKQEEIRKQQDLRKQEEETLRVALEREIQEIQYFSDVTSIVRSIGEDFAAQNQCEFSYSRAQISIDAADANKQAGIGVFQVSDCESGEDRIFKYIRLEILDEEWKITGSLDLPAAAIFSVENIEQLGNVSVLDINAYADGDPECCASLYKQIRVFLQNGSLSLSME